MVYTCPSQDKIIEHSTIPTIRSSFKDHEVTYIVLHPFLKVKPRHSIVFDVDSWPTKKQIITNTENMQWAEIVVRSGLNDISEVDRLLAYLHSARRHADKDGWIKFKTLLDAQALIPAGVDYLPDSLINPLMQAIKSLGYTDMFEFDCTGNLKRQHAIDQILQSEERDFNVVARVETADRMLSIVTDFDLRFSYLSATKETALRLIEAANLEGFFCNETTRPDWSFIEQKENVIDWQSPERRKLYA